jgi:hypothetical protein
MAKSWITVEAKVAPETGSDGAAGTGAGELSAPKMKRIAVTLRNPSIDPVAFFNRISLINPVTKLRVLPVFYSDNYVSVLPGESKTIVLEYAPDAGSRALQVSVRGWNVEERSYPISGQ